jgi:hypothetical protein
VDRISITQVVALSKQYCAYKDTMKVLETLTGLWTKGLYMARRKVALASTFLQGVDPRIYVTFVFSKCLLNKELCERLGWVSMRRGW